MPGLDYSAARLSGGAIRSAGYDFVIRYVGTPGRTKNITAAEYHDLVAAGVAVALVYENVAEDALGGFAAGQGAARAARADADSIGFPANRPIYFAVDWVAIAPQMPAVMAYLDGAADVLGIGQVGVYGFQLTIRTAMDGGHARWFWQCGALSALVPGSHLYQHNNDNTSVSGITCDVNDALAPDFGQNTQSTEVADMTPDESIMLADIHEQMCGNGNRAPGPYNGWELWDGSPNKATIVDMLRAVHGLLLTQYPTLVAQDQGGDPQFRGNVADYVRTGDANSFIAQRLVNSVSQSVAALIGKVDGLTTALQQTVQHGSVDLAAVTRAAEDGTNAALAAAHLSGNAPVSNPAPAPPTTST
jgi:hypothetical protein